MAQKAQALRITLKNREELKRLSTVGSVRVAMRARAVLGCSDGLTPSEVAEDLGCYPNRVIQWRERFREGGIEALFDRKCPGAPKRYVRTEVISKIKKLLEDAPPKGHGKWTGALLADKLKMNRHVVWQLLRREGINLARKRSWCVSTDPEFARKAADIVGLYTRSR